MPSEPIAMAKLTKMRWIRATVSVNSELQPENRVTSPSQQAKAMLVALGILELGSINSLQCHLHSPVCTSGSQPHVHQLLA